MSQTSTPVAHGATQFFSLPEDIIPTLFQTEKMTPQSECRQKHFAFCMKTFSKAFLVFIAFFSLCGTILAQAPTSLQYPASNTAVAHVTSMYLAPTFAGSATSLNFTISPALPAGLFLNAASGVISGVPTVASSGTYTVTATNGAGSANTTFSLTTSNFYYDDAFNPIRFMDASRTFKVGNGQAGGDIALYTNVVTIGGQVIDCIVKTVSVTNVSSWTIYDQNAASGGGFTNNDDKYFSPQVSFNTGGGDIVFEFQFILGGSYNNTTNTGSNVTLQNVYINSYDIDGNGNTGSNQFNDFEGFTKYEIAATSNLSAPVYQPTTGLSRFTSATNANNGAVTDDIGRIRLSYDDVSNFKARVGAGANGAAYFFLDLSIGISDFTGSLGTNTPKIDLHTGAAGLANGASGCASALSFTQASQANTASPTPISELWITYNNSAVNLPNGANETLLISGFTAGTGSHALNFSSGSTSSVTVGGVTYTVTKSVSGTTNKISFTNGGTFTVAQAEALADALQYSNTAASPTNGDRNFFVRVRNTEAESPEAAFTATLNCVTISGNIYHDANGLTDATVNPFGSAMGQFAANGAYAVLTNPATNAVIATTGIAAGGAYTFGRREAGAYNVFINSSSSPGANLSASAFPTGGYGSTGENLAAAAGNDGMIDSKISVTIGSIAINNANLGIQIPPSATDFTAANQNNPGGFNFYTVPAASFVVADADGSVQSITITSFPGGANYLKYGSIIYTNGGTCPPQSSCTAWPGTLVVPVANINTLAVDPAAAGATSVSISYTALDNAAARSNNNVATTVAIPFVATSTVTITGNVWNDANGDGVKDAAEALTDAASSGELLYALLIQKTNTYSGAVTILNSIQVSATSGYSFTNVPAGNDYEVRIVSRSSIPADGVAKSTVTPGYATGYFGVSANNGGSITANQNTNDLVNALGVVSANKTGINFGIERAPETTVLSASISNPSVNSYLTLNGGSNPPVFNGSDPEDQPGAGVLTNKKIAITSLPTNGQLFYNSVQITLGDNNTAIPSLSNPKTISNFDPTKLQIRFTGSGYSATTFNYAYVDAANMMDQTPASYTLTWASVLPLHLVSFTGKAAGATAQLAWTSKDETGFREYVLERSNDATSFAAIATIAAKGSASNEYNYNDDISAIRSTKIYYRLKQVDDNGKFTYSAVVTVSFVKSNGLTVLVTPNPVKGPVTAFITANAAASGLLTISDLSGRIMMMKTIKLTAGTNTVLIEGNNSFANGTYVLSVELNGVVSSEKFIVQR